MTRTFSWTLLAMVVALAAVLMPAAFAAEKADSAAKTELKGGTLSPGPVDLASGPITATLAGIQPRCLIITGQNGHKWAETTPVIKEMLEKTGKFAAVDVLTSPPKGAPKADWEKFKPDFSKYAVVVSNYQGDPWPEAVQKDFEKFVADGGGFVAYHFAVAGFEKWDAFNKMIGIGWRGDANFGEGVYVSAEGKVTKRAKGEGTGSGHPPAHLYDCTVFDKDSPITKGLPEKWTHAKDELYASLRGPVGDLHILVTAFAPKGEAKGQTGENEPVVWTNSFGKGRIFVSVLGHEKDELQYPDTSLLLERGVEWAATGAVTIPVPAGFPKLETKPVTK